MVKRYLYWLLLLLLLADTGYSFLQHYRMPLDGDMAAIIWPSDGYAKVLNDPFAWKAVVQGETYPAPNRFFAHGAMRTWFRNVPLWLQSILPPIDSVYAACALAKTGIQVFLICMLALYIAGPGSGRKRDLLLAAALVVPLFQTAGYNQIMGIIDKSITYNFFYALPHGLLMLYFYPLYRAFSGEGGRKAGWAQHLVLAVPAIVLAFSGPLVPGVVLIVVVLAGMQKEMNAVQRPLFYSLLFLALLCAWSFYAGRFNAENPAHEISVWERYLRIPEGLFHQFTLKPGPALLLGAVLLNAFLIRKYTPGPEGQKILRALKWIGIFSLLFLLLLPWGGYREYRPNIVRRDTLMPVFLCLFWFFGLSSLFLARNLRGFFQKIFWAGLLGFLCIFTFIDEFRFNDNACEREALEQIAMSKEVVVPLEAGCKVMSWDLPSDPASSEWNARLLEYWGVTGGKKLFFHKE